MDHSLQAGKNFAWMSISQVILRILGLAFFVFMSFKLGGVKVGQYGFVISFTYFWFMFIDFGAGGYLYRQWAKGKSKMVDIEYDFNIVFTMRLLISLLVFIPFLIVNYYINGDVYLSLILFFISTFVAIFLNLSDAYFNAVNLFRYTSIRQVIEKAVMVTLGVIFLFFYPKLEMVFVAMIFGQLSSLVYYILYTLPFKFRLIFNCSRAWSLAKKGLPFLFIVLFTSIYSRVDMIMLRYLGDFQSVGLYTTAYRFLDLAAIFSAGLFIPSIFPILSSLYNDSALKEKMVRFFNQSLRILFSTSILITLSLVFFSPLLIQAFFPPSFSGSILALRILILVQVIGSFSALFSNMLAIQHKEKKGLVIIIICALFNIVLNFILIPMYSLYGAAWATVIAEVLNLILLQYFVSWNKNGKLIINMFLMVIINGAILAILKYSGQLNNIYFGTAFLLTNVYVLYKIKLLRKNDLNIFVKPIKLKLISIFNK